MDLHVKVLAAFHLILGVLGLMGSLLVVLVSGGLAGIINMAAIDDPNAFLAVPVVGLLGGILVMLILTLSVPGIIAGVGLLKRRPWARILTIVLSVLNLVIIPFGTLLGIYGLWVLLSQNTAPLFGVASTIAPVAPPTPRRPCRDRGPLRTSRHRHGRAHTRVLGSCGWAPAAAQACSKAAPTFARCMVGQTASLRRVRRSPGEGGQGSRGARHPTRGRRSSVGRAADS